MQKKRLIMIGIGVFGVLVIALLVIPGFIDWSKYQTLAKEKVAASTGYDLTIGGAFRVGFLPRPHLSAQDVIVRKPVDGRSDTFLTLESVDVRLALLPLLAGKIDISSISLDAPIVNMITYKDGKDNWKPVTPASATTAETPAQATPAQVESKEPAISVGAFHIKGGHITIRDDVKGTTQDIGIEELKLKADSMSGPFEGDGTIAYNEAEFDIDLSTGGYREGESVPLQLEVKDIDGRASLKWNGIVATKPAFELQGETTLKFNDLRGVLADAGMPAAVPQLGETTLTGMLTANANHASLTNGNLTLGKAKMATSFSWDKNSQGGQALKATIDTKDAIDLDEVMKVAEKVSKEASEGGSPAPSKDQAPSDAVTVKPFLPSKVALPLDLSGDVQVRASGLKYKGQQTGPLSIQARLDAGNVNGRINIADMPGGGDIVATADLKGNAEPDAVMEGNVIGSLESLKTVFADWLNLVDAKTLEQPGIPTRASTELSYKVSGYIANATITSLSFGETKLTGGLSYTAAKRPVLNVRLVGNVLTLPEATAKAETKAEAKKETTETTTKSEPVDLEKSLEFDPPQLPFDAKFDISLGRLVRGDMVLSDVRAAGAYDGKGISLSTGQATTKGGTLSAVGKVADLKGLSGIDIQAGLKTDDLESFYKAMTGKALALEQKIGAIDASVKAKGDRDKLDTTISAQARGYNIQAAGVLDDPFSPDLPGTLNVRVRHPDFVEAMRVFSPGFGSGTGSPIDIAANVSINGKVYEIKDLKGTMGASDIGGTLRADLSGAKPSFKADLTSNALALGDFVGVKSQAPTAAAAAGAPSGRVSPSVATRTSHWSREALDTGFLKAADVDIKINATTLTYGTWVLNAANLGAKMGNGSLTVSPITAKIYGGELDANLSASSTGDNAPLNIAFKADGKNVNIGSFMSALTASTTKKADGTGSISVDLKGAGTSSAALVGSLGGKVDIATRTLIIHGMDLDKLAANMVEAFDGGWKGVLAGVTTQGFAGGSTEFKDVDQSFVITSGNMPVDKFRMDTSSGNATMISNGNVNFANWTMDLDNQVQVTQPKDTPVIGMRLSGPLDAPQKSINSAALDNLLRGKIGDKVQDLIGDKIKDGPAKDILNQFLPGLTGGTKTPAVTPVAPAVTTTPIPAAPVATPAAKVAPVTETPAAVVTPAPVTEAAPAEAPAAAPVEAAPVEAAPAPVEEKSDEEKAMDVINQLIQ